MIAVDRNSDVELIHFPFAPDEIVGNVDLVEIVLLTAMLQTKQKKANRKMLMINSLNIVCREQI
jgi:hypothetical protein